jgi:hypothetical protein
MYLLTTGPLLNAFNSTLKVNFTAEKRIGVYDHHEMGWQGKLAIFESMVQAFLLTLCFRYDDFFSFLFSGAAWS